MKHAKYALALMFEETQNTVFINMVRSLFRCIEGSEIPSKSPTMGTHLTILPPFEASSDEAHMLSLGVSVTKQLLAAQSNDRFISPEFLKEEFFEDENSCAVVLRYTVDNAFRELIVGWRARFETRFKFVHPPESFFFNPHITIAECVGVNKDQIITQMEASGNRATWERLLSTIKREPVYLSNLRVMHRVAQGWVPLSF